MSVASFVVLFEQTTCPKGRLTKLEPRNEHVVCCSKTPHDAADVIKHIDHKRMLMIEILLFGLLTNACRDNAGEHRGVLLGYDLLNEGSADFDVDIFDAAFLENHYEMFNQEVEALIQTSFLDILGPYKFLLAKKSFRSKLQSETENLRNSIQLTVEKFNKMNSVTPRCFDYKPDLCNAVSGISQLLSDCSDKLCPMSCGKCSSRP